MSHRNEVVTGVTAARVTTLAVAFVAVVAGIAFVVVHIILAAPPVENYTPYASGGQVNVVMQTDPQNTVSNKPDWPSYFIQNPQTKQWVHTTYFEVPANTKVNMTIYGYDGCTPLRNPIWGHVTGTIGGVEYKRPAVVGAELVVRVQRPAHVHDAGPGHQRPDRLADDPEPEQQPVRHVALHERPARGGHVQLHDPGVGGTFRWQCIIPCGLGYLDGNGGPMGTPGYMSGQMEVDA